MPPFAVMCQGRRMKLSSQERQHVLIIPGSLLATCRHADLGCSAVADEVDGHLAQDSQVASCRPIPHAAVILTEGDIQDPMEPIFDRPMLADCLDQDLGVIAAAGQEIADLRFNRAGAADPADGFHRQHGAQPGPRAQRFQAGSLRADERTPTDQAAMAVVKGIEDRPARGAAGETGLLTTRPYRQKRLALIGLEDQPIIRVPFQDPASDRLLAAHGIQRWQPMASNVTMQLFKDSVSSSAGIAVISFDLPSTSRWPSTKPCSLAQALTRCNGPCARPRSKERRSLLPSIATTSRWTTAAKDCAQALKQTSKAFGSISMKTRRKVSCEGMPWTRVKKDCSQPSLLRP